MIIDTRAIGFSLSKPIADRVQSRVTAALAGTGSSLRKVTVRLHDVNSARGGIDKRCRIVVAMPGRSVAVADALNADLYAAIDESARRLRRTVMRASKQHLARERRDPRRCGVLVAL